MFCGNLRSLQAGESLLCGKNLYVEYPKDRVIFEKSPNWPWPQMNNMGLERLIRLVPGKKYHVQIIVDDTIATLYVDGVALNTRMYTNPGEGICLGVTDGSAVFENQSIAYL